MSDADDADRNSVAIDWNAKDFVARLANQLGFSQKWVVSNMVRSHGEQAWRELLAKRIITPGVTVPDITTTDGQPSGADADQGA